jgi:hypothetical protein
MSGDNLKVSGGRGRHLCGNCGGLFFKFFRPSRRLDELLQGNCRQGCGGGGGRIKGVDGGTPLPDKRMAFLQTRRRQACQQRRLVFISAPDDFIKPS